MIDMHAARPDVHAPRILHGMHVAECLRLRCLPSACLYSLQPLVVPCAVCSCSAGEAHLTGRTLLLLPLQLVPHLPARSLQLPACLVSCSKPTRGCSSCAGWCSKTCQGSDSSRGISSSS